MMIRLLAVCCACGVFLASSGCVDVPRTFGEAEKKAVIPNFFLDSAWDPLDDWLNTPFKVRFYKADMQTLLNSFPLNEIKYRVESRPSPEVEPFTVDSPGITRRQLLWSIARHWRMTMHVEYERGLPSAIVIRDRH